LAKTAPQFFRFKEEQSEVGGVWSAAAREVNADDLETKSSRSKDTNVLLSTLDAISHPPVTLLSGILA
jgi:hypothetical protein